MTVSLGVLVLAVVCANLPFVSRTSMFFFWLQKAEASTKTILLTVVDLLLYFILFMAIAIYLEWQQGAIYPKNVDFYVIMFSLFVVFAYPGYVYRFLYRKKNKA